MGRVQSVPEFFHLGTPTLHPNVCAIHKAKDIVPKIILVSLLLLLWSLSLPITMVNASYGYHIIIGERDYHISILTLRY
jgi:hypothetical protein